MIHLSHGCFLSKQKYIRDLLKRFKLDGVKEVATPISTSSSLKLLEGSAAADPTLYRQLVGALQYLSLTRPMLPLLSTCYLNSCINLHSYIGMP